MTKPLPIHTTVAPQSTAQLEHHPECQRGLSAALRRGVGATQRQGECLLENLECTIGGQCWGAGGGGRFGLKFPDGASAHKSTGSYTTHGRGVSSHPRAQVLGAWGHLTPVGIDSHGSGEMPRW